MSKLRVGLVGLGLMGRNHARVLRELENVDFAGVADPAGDRTQAAAGVPLYPDVRHLLDEQLDACVVAAPTGAHLSIGLQLADACVPALFEKPLAQDVASAERLREAYRHAGIVGAVGHIERFNPALRELRSRLVGGQLGDVFQIATRRQSPFPSRVDDVGVVLDLATHDIDLTAWVAGAGFHTLAARASRRSGREHEDLIAAVGTLRDGTVTNHLVNWLTPMKERTVTVTGQAGCFVVDLLTADLTFHQNGSHPVQWDTLAVFRGVTEGDATRYAISKTEPLRSQLESFLDVVRGQTAETVSLAEGVEVVRTAEAMRAAASKGCTVELERGPAV